MKTKLVYFPRLRSRIFTYQCEWSWHSRSLCIITGASVFVGTRVTVIYGDVWHSLRYIWTMFYKCAVCRSGRAMLCKFHLSATSETVRIDMCAQWRLKSAYFSGHSDQSLHCPHEQILHPWLLKIRPVKNLIRLRECAGWSESSLEANVRRYVFWRSGSFQFNKHGKYPGQLWTCIPSDINFFCILLSKLNLWHYENTPIQIYWKFYHQKNENFQMKNSCNFHISVQNIDYGYSLKPPCRGGPYEYPQSMFLSRNKKNNLYPCKPQFYCIKVGLNGVKTI